MDQHLKQKIVARLRSEPEENHITGSLKRGCKFCAMGLIADVCGVEWCGDCISRSSYNHKFDLPKDILDFLGISEKDQHAIIMLNDDELKSFSQISNYIESFW